MEIAEIFGSEGVIALLVPSVLGFWQALRWFREIYDRVSRQRDELQRAVVQLQDELADAKAELAALIVESKALRADLMERDKDLVAARDEIKRLQGRRGPLWGMFGARPAFLM